MYADDIMIWGDNEKELESSLEKWGTILNEYGLKINEYKTVVMTISRDTHYRTKIQFNGKHLKEVENFSYLGCEVNKDGKMQHEISRRINNSSKCYHLVKS